MLPRLRSRSQRALAAVIGASLALVATPRSAEALTTSTTAATSTTTWEEVDPSTDLFSEDAAAPELEEMAPADGSTEAESLPLERRALVIEAIDVVGNTKTAREVILTRLTLEVGDLLDDTRIDESRLRLLATGFFKSVELSLRRGSRRGRVVLVIEVEERNTITISGIYLGFSSVVPFYGGAGVLESNFLGRGVSAGAGFVVGKDRRGVDVMVFVPDLSNTPLQLSATGIFVQGAELLDPSDPSLALAYSRVGGTIGIGFGAGRAQRVSLDYRFESIHTDRLPNLDPAVLRSAPSIQFDESVLSTLALTYERDTRDDAFVPSRGQRIALTVETGTSLLGSSYEFTRYNAEGQIAFPVLGTHALSLRLQAGMVQGSTPFFNQFFLNDFAYFVFGRDSLPRAIQINYSESNDYDDLILSIGADYSVPIQEDGDFLYRTYLYAGVQAAASASLGEPQEDPSGRGIGDHFPGSFDAGIRFDTWIGNLTVSLAYIFDLVL